MVRLLDGVSRSPILILIMLVIIIDGSIFVSWVDELFKGIPRSLAVYNPLDRASTSIPLNSAEGNSKYTEADRCRFFDIARGSALECAVYLVAKKSMNVVESDARSAE